MKMLRKYFFWIIFCIFFLSFIIACSTSVQLTGVIKDSNTEVNEDSITKSFWVHVSKPASYYMLYIYVPHEEDWALAVTQKRVVTKKHREEAKHTIGYYHEIDIKGYDRIKVVVRVVKTDIEGYGQGIKLTKIIEL